jgi:isopentenyldiphosphate isomerase
MREAQEELGLTIDLTNQAYRLSVAFEEGFDDIYVVKVDTPIEDIVIQKNEVSEVKWVDQAELKDLIEAGEFVPYIYAKNIFDYNSSASESIPM